MCTYENTLLFRAACFKHLEQGGGVSEVSISIMPDFCGLVLREQGDKSLKHGSGGNNVFYGFSG